MNIKSTIYSVASAGVLTFVAHHSQFQDVGFFVLAAAAHLLHILIATDDPASQGG